MADAKGIIASVDGDYALVRMEGTGCGRCHEPGGCGGVNIGKMFCSTPPVFRVASPENSLVGQHVSVAIPDGAVRKSALIAYGVPLLLLLAGAFLGSGLSGDGGAIVGAVCGLAASLPILRFAQSKNAARPQFQPYIRAGNPEQWND